jgi:hypothetical protein
MVAPNGVVGGADNAIVVAVGGQCIGGAERGLPSEVVGIIDDTLLVKIARQRVRRQAKVGDEWIMIVAGGRVNSIERLETGRGKIRWTHRKGIEDKMIRHLEHAVSVQYEIQSSWIEPARIAAPSVVR